MVPPAPVDGLTPAPAEQPESASAPQAAPAPAPAPKAPPNPQVKKWKSLLITIGVLFYIAYAVWCLGLMAVLPSPTGDFEELIPIALLSLLVGSGVLLAVAGVGLMRVRDVQNASPQQKMLSLIILAITVGPGLALSALVAFAITQEPALPLKVTKPVAGTELIAPITMTFSAADAVDILRKRGTNPVKYRWDVNGDGKVDQETLTPTVTVTYERDGIYNVAVGMVDAAGLSRRASYRFTIRQSVFTVTPNPTIVDQPVVFSISNLVPKEQKDTVERVNWFFDGDDKVDDVTTGPESSTTYYTLGKQTVVAIVELKNKTQQRYERTIDVQEPPELAFPAVIRSTPRLLIGAPPFTALFRVETAEPLAIVQWSFGDGDRAEGVQAVHTFDGKGSFPVTAKIRSASGEIVDLTSVVRVVDPLNIPDLAFDAATGTPTVVSGKITGEVPLTLDLTPRTSQQFVQFSWEAPDATEVGSTDQTLQAIYRREGKYTVTLVAQDLENHVLRLPIQVEVKPPEPLATFQMRPETGVAPLRVEVDASASDIPDIAGYEWTFERQDQTKIGSARAEHVYLREGRYTLGLKITTKTGKEYRAEKVIVVRPPLLLACIQPSRTTGPAPLSIEFSSGCSTGDFTGVLWDFGDGAQSDLSITSHTFSAPGTYTVSLTITTADKRTARTTTTITVRP